MLAAAVLAATMFTACMAFPMGAAIVILPMVMVACSILGGVQLSRQQSQHRRIRAAAHTCVQLNAGFRQGALRASADAAAYQRLRAVGAKELLSLIHI